MYNFDYDFEHLPLYLPFLLTQLKSYNKQKSCINQSNHNIYELNHNATITHSHNLSI